MSARPARPPARRRRPPTTLGAASPPPPASGAAPRQASLEEWHASESGQAFARRLPEMLALDAKRLEPLNADTSKVIVRALAAGERLAALRPRIAEELPRFDLARFDAIRDYALALEEAYLRRRTAPKARDDLAALNREGMELRVRLRSSAAALALHGLLEPSVLAKVTGRFGYQILATELTLLATYLDQKWRRIRGKTAITAEEIARAEHLGYQLTVAIGARRARTVPDPEREAKDLERRAFTLLVRAYDDARRAAAYLHGSQGGADRVLPSLFGRRKRKPKPGAAAARAG